MQEKEECDLKRKNKFAVLEPWMYCSTPKSFCTISEMAASFLSRWITKLTRSRLQLVKRGEINNGAMVAAEQNVGVSTQVHYATRPKPPHIFVPSLLSCFLNIAPRFTYWTPGPVNVKLSEGLAKSPNVSRVGWLSYLWNEKIRLRPHFSLHIQYFARILQDEFWANQWSHFSAIY